MALTFSLPAAIGPYIGTLGNGSGSGRALILAFVPVMLAAALLTYRGGDSADDSVSLRTTVLTQVSFMPAAQGWSVGVMTGFFGVGGGFLIVPALTTLLGFAMRRAIATSLAIITLTGLAALASHLVEGAQPDWALTLVLSAAAAAGALLGSLLGRRLPARTLAQAFGAVVALVAVFLLVDVLFLGGPPIG